MAKQIMILAAFLALMPAFGSAEPFVSPGQFIRGKTLVSFRGAACGACNRQLPILIDLAQHEPDVQVVLVKPDAGDALPHALPSTIRVIEVQDIAMSLRNFGAPKDSLPYNAFLRENGSPCQGHAGLQSLDMFEAWAQQC